MAYEMRISDWSSDVCSSDLAIGLLLSGRFGGRLAQDAHALVVGARLDAGEVSRREPLDALEAAGSPAPALRGAGCDRRELGAGRRAEARRVGKVGVRRCRSRWSTHD